jgi:hypothetical protein
MPFVITDQELVVGALTLEDALNLPADDTITSATWSAVDTTDSGTDVTVVAGDASSGTNDGNVASVTVSATGTGEGTVSITGTIGTASGASLLVTDTGTVNGGPAATVGVTWGSPAAIPAPPAPPAE